MDPDETLRLCLDALCQKDYEAAFYHAQDLRDWSKRGGFVPEQLKQPVGNTTLSCDVEIWCNLTMRLCKALSVEKETKNAR